MSLTTLVALFVFPGRSYAATIQVDTTSDTVDVSPGNGVCADSSGMCSLRAAIQETNALPGPDSIDVPAGLYLLTLSGPPETAGASGDVDIRDELSIIGASPGLTLIDGTNSHRVIDVPVPTSVQISNLTIQNGGAEPYSCLAGTGIATYTGATVALTNLDIRNNRGCSGGGVANGGQMTVTNSTVQNNQGEGIYSSGSLDVQSSSFANNNGSAISSYYGSLTVEGSSFNGNHNFGDGGAIDARGSVVIRNSTFNGNSATAAGGAISLGYSFTPFRPDADLSSILVTNNTSSRGGGIAIFEGAMKIEEATIDGNYTQSPYSNAVLTGGGIYNQAKLTVERVTISNNHAAAAGGGIYNYGLPAKATFTNSTISGNSAAAGGGGLVNEYGTSSLTATTVAFNTADSDSNGTGDGGGTYQISGQILSFGSIVADNTSRGGAGNDCRGQLISTGYSLIEDTTGCSYSAGPGDITGADPLIGPLAANSGATQTHALLFGSLAIDAFAPCPPPTTDQRNVGRPRDGDGDGTSACDIGAYELAAQGAVGGLVEVATSGGSNQIPPLALLLVILTIAVATCGAYRFHSCSLPRRRL